MILLTSKLCEFNTCSHVTDPASSSIGPDNSQHQYRRGLRRLQRALTVRSRVTHVTPTLTIAGEAGQRMIKATRVLTGHDSGEPGRVREITLSTCYENSRKVILRLNQ